MARSSNATEDPSVVKKRRRNKASWIRRRIEAGDQTVSAEQRAFLDAYDREHAADPRSIGHDLIAAGELTAEPPEGSKPSPSPDGATVPPAPSSPDSTPARAASEGSATSPPAPAPSSVPPPSSAPRVALPPAPTPAPPRVDLSVMPSSSGDWRDRYREKAGGDGREAVCRFVARHHQGFLRALAADLKLAGVEPAADFESSDFECVLVLAWDQILPPHLKLTPVVQVATVTTVVTAQRVIKSKAIKERKELAQAAARIAGGASTLRPVPSSSSPRPSPSSSSPTEPAPAPAPSSPIEPEPVKEQREHVEPERSNQPTGRAGVIAPLGEWRDFA